MANAFQLTKPISLESIDSGMTIRVMTVNGEPAQASDFGIPSDWLTDSCETVVSLSAGIARQITKHLAIPNECLSLVWSRPQDHTVIVTLVLTPLSDHGWDMLREDAESTGREACMVCWQPCVDADDYLARELNCKECEPCNLCDRCRAITPSGTPICYLCLQPEARSFLEARPSQHRIRLRLLAPDTFSSPTS